MISDKRSERSDVAAHFGVLQPLMADPRVEEIIVNAPDRIFAIRDGRKERVRGLAFANDAELRDIVRLMLLPTGRRLDESSPMIDARLSDSSRLNAAIPLEEYLPDCVALHASMNTGAGEKEIRIRDLVRNALRMRPTRIIVGEVRGAEALDMLLAMNTGHEGSLTTIHGNSPRDALDRLGALAQMAEERLSGDSVTRMVARTIDLVLQLRAEPRTGRRRLVGIFEVTGVEGPSGGMPIITGQDLWSLDQTTDILGWTGIPPRCLSKISTKGVSYSLPPASEARGTRGIGVRSGGR